MASGQAGYATSLSVFYEDDRLRLVAWTNIAIDNISKRARALGVEAYELMRARPSV